MNNNQQVYIQYVNLLYHDLLSLLHISATYCGHLQGSIKVYNILLADTENTTGVNHFKKNKNVGVSVNMGPPARALTVKCYLLNFRLEASVDTVFKFHAQRCGAFLQ